MKTLFTILLLLLIKNIWSQSVKPDTSLLHITTRFYENNDELKIENWSFKDGDKKSVKRINRVKVQVDLTPIYDTLGPHRKIEIKTISIDWYRNNKSIAWISLSNPKHIKYYALF